MKFKTLTIVCPQDTWKERISTGLFLMWAPKDHFEDMNRPYRDYVKLVVETIFSVYGIRLNIVTDSYAVSEYVRKIKASHTKFLAKEKVVFIGDNHFFKYHDLAPKARELELDPIDIRTHPITYFKNIGLQVEHVGIYNLDELNYKYPEAANKNIGFILEDILEWLDAETTYCVSNIFEEVAKLIRMWDVHYAGMKWVHLLPNEMDNSVYAKEAYHVKAYRQEGFDINTILDLYVEVCKLYLEKNPYNLDYIASHMEMIIKELPMFIDIHFIEDRMVPLKTMVKEMVESGELYRGITDILTFYLLEWKLLPSDGPYGIERCLIQLDQEIRYRITNPRELLSKHLPDDNIVVVTINHHGKVIKIDRDDKYSSKSEKFIDTLHKGYPEIQKFMDVGYELKVIDSLANASENEDSDS